MSGGPRGTPPPLDLQAVEVRVRYANISNSTEALLESLDDAAALLAHARALRKALAVLRIAHAEMYSVMALKESAEREAQAMNVVQRADVEAAAVLAAAQDGPA